MPPQVLLLSRFLTSKKYLLVSLETLFLVILTYSYSTVVGKHLLLWPFVGLYILGYFLGFIGFVFASGFLTSTQTGGFGNMRFWATGSNNPAGYSPEEIEMMVATILPVLVILFFAAYIVLLALQIFEWVHLKRVLYPTYAVPGVFLFLCLLDRSQGLQPSDSDKTDQS